MNSDVAVPRILVVDDEPLIREGIARCLTGRAEVVTVPSAEDAFVAIGTGDFDLCLLDVFLPGMNGLDAMRKISEMSPAIKVAIMTGSYLTDDMRKRIENEAYTFIEKPFNISLIREVADGIFNQPDIQFRDSGPDEQRGGIVMKK